LIKVLKYLVLGRRAWIYVEDVKNVYRNNPDAVNDIKGIDIQR